MNVPRDPVRPQVTAAQRFSVSYHKYYRVVTVFDPNTKLYGSNYEQYILVSIAWRYPALCHNAGHVRGTCTWSHCKAVR